jgi:hypothetical protein
MQLTCGELGVSVSEFWNLTMRELINIVIGARKRQEVEYKNGWDMAQYTAYYSMAVHLKNPPPINTLLPLPWRKSSTTTWTSTRERYDELVKKWCKN